MECGILGISALVFLFITLVHFKPIHFKMKILLIVNVMFFSLRWTKNVLSISLFLHHYIIYHILETAASLCSSKARSYRNGG